MKEEENLLLRNSLRTLLQENGKLKDDLQNACKESEELAGKISVIKEELLQLQEKNTSLEEQIAISDAIIKSLKDKADMLHIKSEKLEAGMAHIYIQKGELLRKRDEISNQELSYVLSEINDLKVNVLSETNDPKVGVQSKAEQTLEIEKLRTKMMNLDEKNKLLLEDSSKQINEKNELLQDVYRLQKEKDDFQQEALAGMQSMKNLESAIARLQEDNKMLETQVKRGTEEILGLRKHMEELHLEHASLISASQVDRRKIEELQLQVEKVEKEMQVLREESERQRTIIFDRDEEKREAIRQLCFSIDHFRHNYKHLQHVLSTLIQNHNRTAAS